MNNAYSFKNIHIEIYTIHFKLIRLHIKITIFYAEILIYFRIRRRILTKASFSKLYIFVCDSVYYVFYTQYTPFINYVLYK